MVCDELTTSLAGACCCAGATALGLEDRDSLPATRLKKASSTLLRSD
jgi:hypothetical protein